jgi:hypothetical protein
MTMSDDDRATKGSRRRVAGWVVLGTLAGAVLASVSWLAATYLKEHSRIRALVDSLGSANPAVEEEAEASLLQLGRMGRMILEGIAKNSPHRADCEKILEELRNPHHSAVLDALIWLARHQNPDGSWSPKHFSACCTGRRCCTGAGEQEFTVGLTGLSLLAFLGSGYSQLSRDVYYSTETPRSPVRFGRVAKRALQWLLAHQSPDGSMGADTPKGMYNHAIATLALSETYGMTAAQLLKDPAQRAIDFLVAAQHPGGGWGYAAGLGQSNSSVTGWAVWALYSGELSELHFPKEAYGGALAWYEGVTDLASYEVGYAKGVAPDEAGGRGRRSTTTAQGILARIFLQKRKSEPALGAVHLLAGDLPEWKPGRIDFTCWHFASFAVFQFDGPDGPLWKQWRDPLVGALVPQQKKSQDGCTNGSWDPEMDRWGPVGGRVYATAINALTLQTFFRYANVFGSGR